jgi:hypothetical protein
MMRWPSCSEMPLAMIIEILLLAAVDATAPTTEYADQTVRNGGVRRMPGSMSTDSRVESDGVVSSP